MININNVLSKINDLAGNNDFRNSCSYYTKLEKLIMELDNNNKAIRIIPNEYKNNHNNIRLYEIDLIENINKLISISNKVYYGYFNLTDDLISLHDLKMEFVEYGIYEHLNMLINTIVNICKYERIQTEKITIFTEDLVGCTIENPVIRKLRQILLCEQMK